MSVTYYVVVPFDRDADGNPKPGEAKQASSGQLARRMAFSLAESHAGAVVFSRTGDPSIGEFQDAVILEQFGDVDLDALSG